MFPLPCCFILLYLSASEPWGEREKKNQKLVAFESSSPLRQRVAAPLASCPFGRKREALPSFFPSFLPSSRPGGAPARVGRSVPLRGRHPRGAHPALDLLVCGGNVLLPFQRTIIIIIIVVLCFSLKAGYGFEKTLYEAVWNARWGYWRADVFKLNYKLEMSLICVLTWLTAKC